MPETTRNGYQGLFFKFVYGLLVVVCILASAILGYNFKCDADDRKEHKKDVVVIHERISTKRDMARSKEDRKHTQKTINKIENNIDKIKDDVNAINVSVGEIKQMIRNRQ